jgi:hypothetical protein
MSEINVNPLQTVILSDYTTYIPVGDKTIITEVKHVERNGHRTVEKLVVGFTYNANGTLNKPIEDPGQVLDILI